MKMNLSLSSTRSYKLLIWFFPLVIAFSVRGVFMNRMESVIAHIGNGASNNQA